MDRKEFIRVCGLLGIALPLQSVMASCKEASIAPDFNGTVSIIGAGPAGMTTGHLLQQRGINFNILEASSSYGGRIRHNRDFADFPISLGGEWLHVRERILAEAVNDDSIEITTELASCLYSECRLECSTQCHTKCA